MSRTIGAPTVDYEDLVLPRANGGTGVAKVAEIPAALGIVGYAERNRANGVVGLDNTNKVLTSLLPDGIAGNAVNVTGTFRMIANATVTFTITDYDSFKNYTVSASNGSISRNGEIITYIGNAVLGNHTFTVNGRTFDFSIELPAPETPRITSPVTNANVLTTSYNFTSSAFVEFGDLATHAASDWQISTSSTFASLAFSTSNDVTNKIAWTVPGLVDGTVYYARVRYKASNGNYSAWSATSVFTIAVPTPVKPTIASPTNNATGVATAPTFGSTGFVALGDNSTHASSDWQVATDAAFTNIVKTATSDAVNKTSWVTSGLSVVTTYRVRVRHRSSNGKVSDWSDAVTFVTTNAFVTNLTIASNTQNYNLRSAAVAAGWNQSDPLITVVTINSGIEVTSGSTGSYAFDTGSAMPAGSDVTLINNGTIAGKGGNGGVDGAGGSGGPGLRVQTAIKITNNNVIAGGGGGGGQGGNVNYYVTSSGEDGNYTWYGNMVGGGGGGGAGYGLASGPRSGSQNTSWIMYSYATGGGNGSLWSGGGGGAGTYGNMNGPNGYIVGGGGGGGGSLGSGGGSGGYGHLAGENFGTRAYPNTPIPSSGGAGGQAVVGDNLITWQSLGTIYGVRS